MTKPLAPGPDYSYPTTYPTSPEDRHGRHLIRRTVGAGAAVLVAGSALAVGLQAARPDALPTPSPASSSVDTPASVVPAPARPAGDDDDEARAPIAKVAPVRAAPVAAPAPAPVASTGGS